MSQPEERAPKGQGREIPVRSVRVRDELWEQFVAKALSEKPPRTASAVLMRFITDYVSGALRYPTMYPLYGDDVIIDLTDYDPDDPTPEWQHANEEGVANELRNGEVR